MIIDAQLHEPFLSLDWSETERETRYAVMLEAELAFMDAVGVDRAVLFPIEDGWGTWAAARMPDRFVTVPMITPPGVVGGLDAGELDAPSFVRERSQDPAVVGMRMMHTLPSRLFVGRPEDGPPWTSDIDMYEPLMQACVDTGLPLFMSTAGALEGPAEVVRRHPTLRVIVDHLGLRQNPTFGLDTPPLRELPKVLALADHPTVHLKLSGAPILSGLGYPFEDLWDGLDALIEAFGVQRLMWGSDISRIMGRAGAVPLAPAGLQYTRHTYAEALFYLRHTSRLTADQKGWLLGGTAASVLGWPA